MNKLFLIQLLISFFVGGGVIAILSFLGEKVSARLAGIILAFPTTVALGFFFLGWTVSAEAVAEIVPATLIPLGLSVLFPALYAYIAEFWEKFLHTKIWQIIASYTLSVGIWFVLALPVILLQFNRLAVGVAGYAVLIALAHYLLHRKKYDKPISLTYTLGQKIGRATFVGVIVVLVVILGRTLNTFWGGAFAMFPAAFSSLMVILHWYYGPKSLFPTMQKVAIGSISILAYAMIVMFTFPTFGFILGTLFAYGVSLVVTLLLTKV